MKGEIVRKYSLITFLVAIFVNALLFAKTDDYQLEGEQIKQVLAQSFASYQNGDAALAKKLAETAYFQHFENIEGTIARNIGAQAYLIEKRFNLLRNLYKNGADMERIEALIGGLVFELDLVLPLLDSSMKLVAEASDTNYDKAAAEAASIAAERQRAKEAEEMFARLLGEDSAESSANTESTPTAPAPQSAQNSANAAMQEFETASRLDSKLYYLYEQISGKFDIAALRLQKQRPLDAASMLEKEVLFDDYRNTKLEIVMNQHTEAGAGQKWQAKIREIVRRLKNGDIGERELRSELAALSDRLFELLLLIPSEAVAIVHVEGFAQESAGTDYANVANDIRIALNAIVDKYGQVPAQALIDELQGVYLDIFEASQMESHIGAMDSNLKLAIESRFTQGVALIKADAPKDALRDNFDALDALIASSLEKIQDLSPAALLAAALVIILREGIEAMLIVLAITAYLLQSGNAKHIGIVHSALGVGVFLSFVTAFAVYYLFAQFAGQFRELLEGITMIIALFLLLYVGFWLLSKSYKWTSYIQAQAQEAIHKGSARVLWWTVFLAVYREGAETVLFYQSLFFSASDSADFWAIIGGLCIGCAILLVLFFVLKAGAVRFPVRLFFQCTSYLIFALCFIFAGKAVAELIEGKLILPTFVPFGFEPITWLGIYPYYETLIPQIAVLCVIVAGLLLTHRLISQQRRQSRSLL